MFHVGFGLDAPARNYRDLLKSDKALYVRFAHALLKRGVRVLERVPSLPPGTTSAAVAVSRSAAVASPARAASRSDDGTAFIARTAAKKRAKSKPGSKVVELIPGGGYFTRIFA